MIKTSGHQYVATQPTAENRPTRYRPSQRPENGEAALYSFLVGWRVRGFLSDRDREFLDNSAPDGWLTFLVDHDDYQHPEGVRLFELDALPDIMGQAGGAVFSQRCSSLVSGRECIHRLWTAFLNPGQPPATILGWFGPDALTSSLEVEAAYHDLIEQVRQVYRGTTDLVEQLRASLATTIPTFLVNRASGRILAANKIAADLLEKTEEQLVDLEFGNIKKALAQRSSQGLVMRNVDQSGINLCLVSLTKVGGDKTATGQAGADPTINTIRHRIVRLEQVSKALEEAITDSSTENARALAREVAGGVRQLAKDVARSATAKANTSSVGNEVDNNLKRLI